MQLLPVALLLGALAAPTASESFNPLKHLAGIAPYRTINDPPLESAPPQGCNVTKAAYLIRHAAIYANDFDYESYLEPFVEKLRNTTQDWSKTTDLKFLANWTAPVDGEHLEKVTKVGYKEAVELGVNFRTRYASLPHPSKVWSSSADRTTKTAAGFIEGYTLNKTAGMDLVEVKEKKDTGVDSLTPYKSCPAYRVNQEWVEKYTAPIKERLNAQAPNFNFTTSDIVSMFEFCGYETVIRGDSPFCATTLFPRMTGSPSNTVRISGTSITWALGLFNNSAFSGTDNVNKTMPTDKINYGRQWKSSDILPFLTNIAIERLSCDSYGYDEGDYYRVLVNSSPQPLEDCRGGPGDSCSATKFGDFVKGLGERFGDFVGACGAPKNESQVVTIYN
ncbi:unnamed protein product [Aspergillus oryzae]|nr:unnamed protein product [Aspergillus oryzae]